MELRGTLDTRGQGLGLGIPASSIITAVQQKEYSAGVWLRRRDKLEHVSSEEQREGGREDGTNVRELKC